MSSLSNLASYYIECIANSMESGIKIPAIDPNPDYGQLFSLPQFVENKCIYEDVKVNSIIQKVRENPNRLTLYLGYPICYNNGFLEPLLLFPFNTNSLENNANPKLSMDSPIFNIEVLKDTSRLNKYELLEKTISLSQDLGLDKPIGEQPELSEIITRLREQCPEWNWREEISPQSLSVTNLENINQNGIYNVAGLFFSEGSIYTQGLAEELRKLEAIDDITAEKTILNQWVNSKFKTAETNAVELIEPFALNVEQRRAVKAALQDQLTVIWGPPGTGKSQVVSSIIINAFNQGQTVLFSSKNHKAVDVVTEKINELTYELTQRNLILRFGNQEFRQELAGHINNILTEIVLPTDEANYNWYKNKFDELIKTRKAILLKEDELIKILNTIEELERNVEIHREGLFKESFSKFKSYKEVKIQEIEAVIIFFETTLKNADKNKQKLFPKLFWFLFRKSRLKSAIDSLCKLSPYFKEWEIEAPNISITQNSLPDYYKLIVQIKERFESIKEIVLYFNTIDKLLQRKSLVHLDLEAKINESAIFENSRELLKFQLRLFTRFNARDRHNLADFAVLLNFIINHPIIAFDWPKFYDLQEKVAKILGCWAVTSLSAKGKIPWKPGFFDLVIIDEASQCDIASALPLLFRAKKAVIIGDDKQLPHISNVNENTDYNLQRKYGLENDYLSWSYSVNSLYDLAKILKTPIKLLNHYRSHSDIIAFSNKEFYGDKLRVDTIQERLISIPNEKPLKWIDVVGIVESPEDGSSSFNQEEINKVVDELRRIIDSGYIGTIGVVTPFRPQANRIRDLVNQDVVLLDSLNERDFLVNTVDKFQGDERDLIIFSTVVSGGIRNGSINFLSKRESENRFNVAITRARANLIIVGNKNYCSTSGISYLQKLVEHVHKAKTPPSSDLKGSCSEYPAVSSGDLVSVWEKIFYTALCNEGIRTLPQYQAEQYNLDLALFINDRKLDIEVDGKAYHESWDGNLSSRDKLRNARLIDLGWDVQRFWVYEIRDDMEGCIKKIKDWLNKEA